ncbi:hypothetical protein CKW39_09120 [Kocuria sp. WRN011]|mgnify:CR=1 FL=1|uniref:Uncharacterized protein n=1 Tax=Kocuria carniphila TaxID=262208 RepID=A0ABV3V536_9MICC|nr:MULTISPECIES: hypothetical protein [Kocuria]MCT1803069.1 hypothetical protein [Kocuria carniphila]PBB08507.1 hypothetical protein CKW39_09120 [Kocuria sp. WRN011]
MYSVDLTQAMPVAAAGLAGVSLTVSQNILSVGVLFFATLALITTVRSVWFTVRKRRRGRHAAATDSAVLDTLQYYRNRRIQEAQPQQLAA